MGYKLVVRTEAAVDITSAVMWYKSDHPERVKRFVAEVDACFSFILRYPQTPAKFHRNYSNFLEVVPFVVT